MTSETQRQLQFAIVAIAASAGGLNALQTVFRSLPETFPLPILVVQHVDPRHKSLMAQILQRCTPLQVQEAQNDDQIEPGHIYIAPPNQHLLVADNGALSLTRSNLVNFVRPSADLMLDSVAAYFGDRSIAVVLTGSGSDGAMGIAAIKKMGGTTIAQNQATSEVFGMPHAAVKTGCVDFVLALDDIAPALLTLVTGGNV